METVLISGGTGLIGRELCKKLKNKGYHVTILSRTSRKDPSITSYAWDPDKKTIDKEAIETADYIIHLAGANIGDKRWTAERKKNIIDSRVRSGQLIFEQVKANKNRLKAFISASAVGFYGTVPPDRIFRETDPPAKDFLAETCRQWEQAADSFSQLGIRTVKIRTGVVLTKSGGALEKMVMPVKAGMGSAIGNGRQYIPWIHIDDLCGIYIKAIEDTQMKGAYNAVAPDYSTNRAFTETLARILNKPFWLPDIPAVIMKIIFGQMSSILLKGNRISSDKIKDTGYEFLYPELDNALENLLTEKQT